MNRHKKLCLNTMYFFIGTLGSKIIQFVLIPFYTIHLTVNEYGSIDMLINIATIIVPIISFNLMESLFRFTMDNEYNKKEILNTVNIFVFIGVFIFLLFWPILKKINYIGDRVSLLFIIVFLQTYQGLFKQFIRAIGKIKVFVFSDILNTISFLIFNIILIGKLNMGIKGYLYSLIISYIVDLLILTLKGGIIDYISFQSKYFNKIYLQEMLRFSIPLIPTAIMLWIITVSDRYILGYILGVNSVGIYSVANKLSAIILVLNGIFFRAWQITAVEESKSKDNSEYFSKAFTFYVNFLFVLSGILILFLRIINLIIIRGSFIEARNYVGILIISTIIASFSNFLSSIFIANKKTKNILMSSVAGAIINIILNFVLIKRIGVLGACIATFGAYFAMFSIRYLGLKFLVNLKGEYIKILISIVILLFQSFQVIKGNIILNFLLFLLLVLNNKNIFKKSIEFLNKIMK